MEKEVLKHQLVTVGILKSPEIGQNIEVGPVVHSKTVYRLYDFVPNLLNRECINGKDREELSHKLENCHVDPGIHVRKG